jgi:glucans biosynthesis protein C
METPRTNSAVPSRRFDNDWLTVLATLTIFLFHCARFFNHEDWHVKNNQLDQGMTLFVAFVAQWIMPLFFVLSGISSYFSLGTRNRGRYTGNRFRRLVIPLVFGSLVVLAPVQVWIERVTHGQFHGGFIEFYPHYFQGLYAFGGNFAWMGLHLWYLEMLFVFTLVTLPLFIWLKIKGNTGVFAGAAAFCPRRGTIYLLAVPVFLVELVVNLQPLGAGIRAFGGWSLFTYLALFITGFLTAAGPAYREDMERSRFISLALGLFTASAMFLVKFDLSPLGEAGAYIVSILFRSFNSWFWIAALFGFGSRHLDFSNAFLAYARKAALPFYILHQTVIVVFGYFIADWEAGVMLKYLVLGCVSFAVIIAIYEFAIKRVAALGVLFGMKGGI